MNGDAGKALRKIVIELDADRPDVAEAVVKGILKNGDTVTFSQKKRRIGATKLKAGEDAPKYLDATSIAVVMTNPCRIVVIDGKQYVYCW